MSWRSCAERPCGRAGASPGRSRRLPPRPTWPRAPPRRGDYRIGVGDDERWADLDRACRAAGFVDIEYLPEPVAAAYAPIKRGAIDQGQIVLVYDFGGGTFDAAIVRIGPREHEVPAADSIQKGGADIDALLIEEIRRVTGATAGSGDGRRDAELKVVATEAKKKLSLRDNAPVASADDGKLHQITRGRLGPPGGRPHGLRPSASPLTSSRCAGRSRATSRSSAPGWPSPGRPPGHPGRAPLP